MPNDDTNLPTVSTAPKLPATKNGTVFDVVRPGKTLASPTSRPVITPKAQDIPDDQLVRHMHDNGGDDQAYMEDAKREEDTPKTLTHNDKQFSFDTAPELPDTPLTAAEPTPALGVEAPAPAVPVSPQPEPVPEPAPAPVPTPPAATNDEVVAQTEAPKLDAVVSHHKKHAVLRVWHMLLTIFLLLFFTAIAADVLIDLGVIQASPSIPHTNLLKNIE